MAQELVELDEDVDIVLLRWLLGQAKVEGRGSRGSRGSRVEGQGSGFEGCSYDLVSG